MNEDYCSYELSKALKAAGFDEPCGCCYIVDKDTESDIECTEYAAKIKWNSAKIGGSKHPYKYISAPNLAVAHKWLREKKGIAINAIAHEGGRYHTERIILPNCMIPESRDWYVETTTPMVYSYEQALSEGIKSALELIKKVE